jgi:hypothetical protein
VGAIAAGLVELLTDDAARDRLAREGRALLARSTWPRAADEVLRAIEDAAAPA